MYTAVVKYILEIYKVNGFSDTCHANKIHDRVKSNLLAVLSRAREIRIS